MQRMQDFFVSGKLEIHVIDAYKNHMYSVK